MNSKFSLPVLIIVFAALGFFYYTSTLKAPADNVSKIDTAHFEWQGIEFDYPEDWHADVWRYSSPAMHEQGQSEEVGFFLNKNLPSDRGGATINITAGGPQSGGMTCKSLKVRIVDIIHCADIKVPNRGETIAMYTVSTDREAKTAFEIIINSLNTDFDVF
ncbi:MAG: hypothetical protein V4526_02770 [Patescibacteria group bacterium]